MYPSELLTTVNVDKITEKLCGAFRPGHFKGVTTVVAKLFNIFTPDIAVLDKRCTTSCSDKENGGRLKFSCRNN